MIEYVEPDAEMGPFFAHPRITHSKTRNWNSTGGQRHWFAIDPALTLIETRELLECLPVGASVVSFDWQYDSPSDPGAWVELQRYPEFWTAKFSNHGWSSWKVPLDFESAVRLYWDGLLIDELRFMGYQRNRGSQSQSEHRADSGLSAEPPEQFQEQIDQRIIDYLAQRVAQIDGSSRTISEADSN